MKINNNIKSSIFLCLAFAAFLMPSFLSAQNVNTEFGKNRIQYHDFEWWQYETRDFIVYWYKEGRNIGESVVQLAELDHEEIRSLMEYRISDKIEILVYTDLTDLKQSNIGKEDVFGNSGGITKIVNNKMFVYFNGDHNHLREQIRQGIARIYLNYMMYGSSLQEIVQNAVLLNLPDWFVEGLVSYIGEDWNTELDNRLRDGILSGKYNSFGDLIDDDPRLAGHSFWYFISQNYGKSTVSNLLYLTRINRNVENGFLYVLGTSFYRISQNWYSFYRQHYSQDANVGTALDPSVKLPVKNKRAIPLSQLRLSPNGQKVVYVSNEAGKTRVYLQGIDGKNRKAILKSGFKNIFQATDYNYPLLSWMPNGQKVAIMYEVRDKIKLLLYNLEDGKSEVIDMPNDYERILSIDFSDNRRMVLSAIRAGYSDVFLFDTKMRQSKQITRDYHDDLSAVYAEINGSKGIIFSSNRDDSLLIGGQKLDTLLPIKSFDLYFYDLGIKKNTELVRLTNTPFSDEIEARSIDERYFTFLNNDNGIYNRSIGYIDTVLAYKERVYVLKNGKEIVLPKDSTLKTLPADQVDTTFIRSVFKPRGFSYLNTNYNRNILEQHLAPRANKLASLFYNEGEYQFYIDDINTEKRTDPRMTHFMRNKKRLAQKEKKAATQRRKPKVKEKDVEKLIEVPENKQPVKDTIPPKTTNTEPDTGKIDIDNYFFQSDFEDEEKPKKEAPVVVQPAQTKVEIDKSIGVKVQEVTTNAPSNKSPIDFRPAKIIPYRTQFKSEFISTQLDNSMMFGGLNPTVDNNPENTFPPLGLLLMVNIEDLFEDYRLRIGARVPWSLNGMEYFAIFDDESSRLDKRYSLYRRNYNNTLETAVGVEAIEYNLVSNIAEAQFRYPLDIYQSFRGTISGRIDQTIYEATDANSLELKSVNEQRLGLRLEYVFDNTQDISMNIKHGTRLKATAEVFNKFGIGLIDSTYFDASTGFLGLTGIDARHYQKLDKHSILAARFAAYTSFGSNKVLYYLGGTNNWLAIPSYNQEIPIPTSEDFVYQGSATNLRGFQSNIRNGNTYALLNVELRVPIMRYFNRTFRSSFINNLQFIGFYDAGTAWEGFSPFREDNPLNTVYIEQQNSPIRVKVNYFRNPLVMGYGFGARTMLFGYYMRLDYAWGVETGIVEDPRLYLSIGYDF